MARFMLDTSWLDLSWWPDRQARQIFFGIQADPIADAGLLNAVSAAPVGKLGWVKAIVNVIRSPRYSGKMSYIADLHADWPADMRAYGIERLRADLIALGLTDETGGACA